MKRTTRHIAPKYKTYGFIVEGKTEYWYLNMIKRHYQHLNFNIRPKLLEQHSLTELFSNQGISDLTNQDFDKVFLIIDFDVIVKEQKEKPRGKINLIERLKHFIDSADNVEVIINNPCLEYWFLLHFENTGKHFTSCSQVIRELKKFIPDYKKTQEYYTKMNNDIFLRLKKLLPIAINNARKHKELDFNSLHNPCAQIYRIFEELEIISDKQ